MDRKKIFAIVVTSIIIIAALAYLFRGAEVKAKRKATVDLPGEYMVFVEEPQDEWDLMFIAALSPLVVQGNSYHPMFILEKGALDQHQLWKIFHQKQCLLEHCELSCAF